MYSGLGTLNAFSIDDIFNLVGLSRHNPIVSQKAYGNTIEIKVKGICSVQSLTGEIRDATRWQNSGKNRSLEQRKHQT